MEIDWPAPWQVDPDHLPREKHLVPGFKEDLANRHLQLNLDPEGLKTFGVLLDALASENDVRKGMIPPVADCPHASAVLGLPRRRGPRPRQPPDQHQGPPDTHDLRVPQPANPGLELQAQEAHLLVYRAGAVRLEGGRRLEALSPGGPRPVHRGRDVDADGDAAESRDGGAVRGEGPQTPGRDPVACAGQHPLGVMEAGKLLEELPPGDEPAGVRRAGPDEKLFRCRIAPGAAAA